MEGGARAGRTHEGQEKSLEGKEAGLLPPWNGKESRPWLEQCPRRPLLRPDNRPARTRGRVQARGLALGTTPTERRCRQTAAHGAGCGPSVRALELLPEKAGRCGQWARRGLGSKKNAGGVDSMFNLWSRGS